nr:hypothetical protein RKE32_15330 [Streptomyces sp. Li-HN-5-13]
MAPAADRVTGPERVLRLLGAAGPPGAPGACWSSGAGATAGLTAVCASSGRANGPAGSTNGPDGSATEPYGFWKGGGASTGTAGAAGASGAAGAAGGRSGTLPS